MKVSSRQSLLLLTLAAVLLLLLAVEPALAAPGGLIKQAARTTWGKVALFGLVLFFLPLILWYAAKRAILVRRTRRALRALGRRAAQFEWIPLKERIGTVFLWVHSAWDQQKMRLAGDHVTEWFAGNQQLKLDKWKRDGLRNMTSDVAIKRLTPLYLSHEPGSLEPDRIVVEIRAEMRDYLVKEATGEVVEGDKTLGELTSVWSFVHEGGRWLLSSIEPDSTSLEYLAERDRVRQERVAPRPA